VRDVHFGSGYINENDLIKQLKSLIDDVDIKSLPMKEKITREVRRYKKFHSMLLDAKSEIVIKNIDLRNYAKFILQEGSIEEQRELIGCLRSNLFLAKKKIYLR
jgi:hypothetical protein